MTRVYEHFSSEELKERIARYTAATRLARQSGLPDLVRVGHEEIDDMLAVLESRGHLNG
ncbi:hypothetical protein ACFXAZ_34455 [Streptomyces sp. NPDC059477]|uniref:hypothetical protein n=1 Tax=Streptomyces sp. NPDC059477 TaxID=3346847 RepID=UPI00368803E9